MSLDTTDLAPVVSLLTNDDQISEESGKRAPRKRVSGRRRFAESCVHGGSAEIPCPKFAHLPGDGRGPYQPGIARTMRNIGISLVKPCFYLGILYLAFILLSNYAVNLLPFHNGILPTNTGVSNGTQHPTNGGIPANPGSNNSVPTGGATSVVHPRVK